MYLTILKLYYYNDCENVNGCQLIYSTFKQIGATDTVRATTTVTVTKEGPIKATSVIESLPQKPHLFPVPPFISVRFFYRNNQVDKLLAELFLIVLK